MLILKVNRTIHKLKIDPETPLLWVLREQLGLTGTKYCCGIGECGACTVHVDGQATLSCTLPAGEVAGKEVITIEGLTGTLAGALRRAWIDEDVPQCGYCQPGQIMAAAALLSAYPRPTEENMNAYMSGVLCRCGTYQDIRKALLRASQEV